MGMKHFWFNTSIARYVTYPVLWQSKVQAWVQKAETLTTQEAFWWETSKQLTCQRHGRSAQSGWPCAVAQYLLKARARPVNAHITSLPSQKHNALTELNSESCIRASDVFALTVVTCLEWIISHFGRRVQSDSLNMKAPSLSIYIPNSERTLLTLPADRLAHCMKACHY